jgi:DNA invertase Pin-like site-specific DNA recombinase
MPLAYSYRRVSTGGQASDKRSGLQRQEEALRDWLRRHPEYQLAEALIDPGVSAYSGRNRQRGALGAFLAAAKKGGVPAGTVLVVEDHRRFSRQEPLEALTTVIQGIWAHGLGFAVCNYDGGAPLFRGNAQAQHLALLAFMFEQAHLESREKSRWSRAAWARTIEAQDKGETPPHRVPYWIDRGADGFQLNNHALALARMVELACAGVSQNRIAEALNAEAVPPPPTAGARRAGRWTRGMVCQRIKDDAIAGVLERTNAPPLPGYYPAAVKLNDLRAARAAITTRDPGKGRRGASRIGQNLFSGVAFCACGSRLIFMPPSIRARPGHPGYFGCAEANGREAPAGPQRCQLHLGSWRGGKRTKNIPADQFEGALLATLQMADWSKLISLDPPTPEFDKAKQAEKHLAEQVAAMKARIQRGEARLAELMIQEQPDPVREDVLARQVALWHDELFELGEKLRYAGRELAGFHPQDPIARLQQLEAQLLRFFAENLLDAAQRRSFNSWLRSLRVKWIVSPDGVELWVETASGFKPLEVTAWSSPNLHALHFLGLQDGVRWLAGMLESDEAVMERRRPQLTDDWLQLNIQLRQSLELLGPLCEW